MIVIICLALCFTACQSNSEASYGIPTSYADDDSEAASSSVQTDNGSSVTGTEHGEKTDAVRSNTAEPTLSGNDPVSSQTDSRADENSVKYLDFSEYLAMSQKERYAYYKTFGDADEFLEWYNPAKEKYEKENPTIIIDKDTVIDLGK